MTGVIKHRYESDSRKNAWPETPHGRGTLFKILWRVKPNFVVGVAETIRWWNHVDTFGFPVERYLLILGPEFTILWIEHQKLIEPTIKILTVWKIKKKKKRYVNNTIRKAVQIYLISTATGKYRILFHKVSEISKNSSCLTPALQK